MSERVVHDQRHGKGSVGERAGDGVPKSDQQMLGVDSVVVTSMSADRQVVLSLVRNSGTGRGKGGYGKLNP